MYISPLLILKQGNMLADYLSIIISFPFNGKFIWRFSLGSISLQCLLNNDFILNWWFGHCKYKYLKKA